MPILDNYFLAIAFPNDYRILLAAYLAICFMVGLGGIDRRIGFWGHFLVSLVMTPLVGVVVLCTSEHRIKEPKKRTA